jgi:hypothetical protein
MVMAEAITIRKVTGKPCEYIAWTTVVVFTGTGGTGLGVFVILEARFSNVVVALSNSPDKGLFVIFEATSARVLVASFNALVALSSIAFSFADGSCP